MLGFRADLIDGGAGNINAESEAVDISTMPLALDWRTYKQGIIAPVKNQGSCGSCYSFASMESLQALYHIKKGPNADGTVINLSE